MAQFASETEVYEVIGELCRRILADPDIGPKLGGLDMAMRFAFRDPESSVVIDCRGGQRQVVCGVTDIPIGLELAMTATDGHRLWMGDLNPVLGLASRKIKASGSVSKAMALQSVLEPAGSVYRSLLEELGRTDLLTVG